MLIWPHGTEQCQQSLVYTTYQRGTAANSPAFCQFHCTKLAKATGQNESYRTCRRVYMLSLNTSRSSVCLIRIFVFSSPGYPRFLFWHPGVWSLQLHSPGTPKQTPTNTLILEASKQFQFHNSKCQVFE